MFLTKKHLSRRTVLKGACVSLALPLLDAMIPAATALAQTAAAPKLRVGFFYIPHGAIMWNTPYGKAIDAWSPSGAGADFKLSQILSPPGGGGVGGVSMSLSSTQAPRNPGEVRSPYEVRSSTAPLPSRPRRASSSTVTRRNCGPWTALMP